MTKFFIGLAALAVGLLLSACAAGPSAAERTMAAQNEALGTEIVNIRLTATVESGRLQVTAQSVETLVAQAREQNQRLAATIEALGGNVALVVPLASTPTPPAMLDAPTAPESAPMTDAVSPPDQAVAAATPTPAAPTLYNAVTARGVGANDCALAPITAFTTADQNIYIVATAASITPGTTLTSRWFYEGNQVISHDFTPSFAINQNCVWFYIDQTETTFSVGNWSVQLEINGQPVGQPVTFSISG